MGKIYEPRFPDCLFSFVFLFAVVLVVRGQRKVAALRAIGVYPVKGKETDADVLRLLKTGNKMDAIKCYRSIHGVGLKEAKDAVELLKTN